MRYTCHIIPVAGYRIALSHRIFVGYKDSQVHYCIVIKAAIIQRKKGSSSLTALYNYIT